MEVALIVLDGWGINHHWPVAGDPIEEPRSGGRDAIATAETPTFDRLLETASVGHLRADGETVGLPPGQMGNSAVGHLTIGAGAVLEQPPMRIDRAIGAGRLGAVPAIAEAIQVAANRDGRLHLWGLLSDGGVHGDLAHLTALLSAAADAGVPTAVHAVTDGRDTPPRCARRFLGPLSHAIDAHPDVHLATVSGRYYAMDRDGNWSRTRRAYEAMVDGLGTRVATDAGDAIERAYAAGEADEFVAPTVVRGAPTVDDGDAVLMANFRADRARQLARMLGDVEPAWPFETDPPSVHLATMTAYDETFPFPVAFETIQPAATLGAALADAGLTQLRIAETEKYAHVTYFLNGGRETRYPGERREIVPSPAVATYDRAPEMSAPEVTDRTIALLEADDPDVLVLNYANPDMVGHTGDFDAAVAAVEAVDAQLGRLLEALDGAHVLVIADHGNADDMGTPGEPHTAHTTNPVPCIYVAPDGTDGGRSVRRGGTLVDVAPTLLTRLGLEVPPGMTGRDLLE
ncbi:MAG: 2,3-bisphosphoglycerate-independent phosphoglycerate mutase [Halobacteriales archaeon]